MSATAAEALDALRVAGARIVAADAHDGEPYSSGVLAPGRHAIALVLGSESHGLDPALPIDHWVRIPMAGGTESLNVAMAGTLLAFETRRGS